ncbi:GAP family protein [Streptomyces antarcticus]|uniref:GAP family protein n=1 Tax=Streptomyces antarcticus TaxID=2996458 RepID=UPI00226F6683|nr:MULTISPECIES: GAP family protein [unclassified Streptomyces]MCY0945810.1 GAP family protein [Streptomyces sp. H34-AA3]MCZ4084029.1 GAP family protein [Streptomyces sp. H34-S5]
MVLDLLLIALAVTLFPLPIMAFVLVVAAPRGVRNGLAFILAWLACLVTVIAVVLFLTGGSPPPPRSPPSLAALVATLVIGVSLIVYSERRRRGRRRDDTAAGPAGQPRPEASGAVQSSRMDDATGWSSAALAVLLQPWGMVGAAAATVVQADLSHGASFVALAAFCLLATSSLLAMELYMVFAPVRAQSALTSLRAWLERHKEPAIVVTCLVLGLWLVGRSLYQLTG